MRRFVTKSGLGLAVALFLFGCRKEGVSITFDAGVSQGGAIATGGATGAGGIGGLSGTGGGFATGGGPGMGGGLAAGGSTGQGGSQGGVGGAPGLAQLCFVCSPIASTALYRVLPPHVDARSAPRRLMAGLTPRRMAPLFALSPARSPTARTDT
jgi:hypothetical protein